MAVEAKSNKKKTKKAPVVAKKSNKSLFDDKPKQGDLSQLVEDIRERPVLYAGIAIFLLSCLLAGFLYRAHSVAQRKDIMTAYAQAMDKEKPADQLAALEPLASTEGKRDAEVVYMTGETAYRAGEYDKAKAAFERVRDEFKNSPYAPDAVEGLGYIAENAKDYDKALGYYKEVRDSWAKSFAARRQPLNIAKLEELRGNLPDAISAYREQMQVFAGSSLADEASAALTRLEKTHPELFPKAAPPTAEATPAPAAAGAPAENAAPGVKLELKAPGVTGESPGVPAGDLNLKLKTPDLGTGTTPPAATQAPGTTQPVNPAESPATKAQ